MSVTAQNGWAPPYVEAEQVSDAVPSTNVQQFLRQHWQIVVGVVLSVAGAVVVLLGWYGAAHTTVLQYQIPYLISGGMLGAALIVLGGIYSFAHLLARNQSRLEQLLFEAIYAAETSPGGAPASAAPPEPPSSAYAAATAHARRADAPITTFVDGTSRVRWVGSGSSFHDPACQMVRGKNAVDGTVDEARAAGLAACRVCRPDRRQGSHHAGVG